MVTEKHQKEKAKQQGRAEAGSLGLNAFAIRDGIPGLDAVKDGLVKGTKKDRLRVAEHVFAKAQARAIYHKDRQKSLVLRDSSDKY